MNRQLQEMFTSAEGRYLTAAEQGLLRDYAQSVDARLTAMSEVSSKETTIVEQTVKEILRAYPDVEKKYKNAMATCIRDETLVLRYTTLAMVRNDPQFLNDSLLTWLATILKGVGFTPHFIEDTYKTMAMVAGRELSPATAKLLHPFVLQCAAVLSGKDSSKEAKQP